MTRLSWVLVFWGIALSAYPQEVHRFEVDVQAVYVDVFVTRDGKTVSGLNAEHFEVLDSGVKQEIRLVDVESVPLSVMMVLDSSGSVWGEKLRNLRAGANAFIDGLRDVDEAGLLAFSYESRLLQGPTQNWASLHQAVQGLASGGPTALHDAVYAGLKLVEGKAGRPLVVLFTDGMDNASWLSASEVLEAVRASEAVIHVIAVQSSAGVRASYGSLYSGQLVVESKGDEHAERLLKDIAENSGGKLWHAASSTGLEEVYLSILEEMGSRYLLSYLPQGAPAEGWHSIEVKLKGEKADEVRARAGYMVSPRRN